MYGVFLNNTILMQFRIYNSQNGLWLSKNDLYLLFLAFTALAFIFSSLTYIFVEGPMAFLIEKFMRRYSKFKGPAPKLIDEPSEGAGSRQLTSDYDDNIEDLDE